MRKNNESVSIGNAGEYFVAGELERHGFTAAVPMSNVKDFDILAINRKDPSKMFAIQVKTTSYKQKKWTLTAKSESLSSDNVIYFFVSLNEQDTPEYHIVPSTIVASKIKAEHDLWLNTPGRNGQKHNDTNLRNFTDSSDTYLNRWNYLGISEG